MSLTPADLKAIKSLFDDRFDRIDDKFELIDARFEQIDARFDQVDSRFEQMDAQFEQIDARFEQIDARFEKVEDRFDQIEQRFDVKLSSVQERLEQKIQRQAEQQTAELVDMMNKIMFSADEHFATKGELRQVQKQVKRISFKIGLST